MHICPIRRYGYEAPVLRAANASMQAARTTADNPDIFNAGQYFVRMRRPDNVQHGRIYTTGKLQLSEASILKRKLPEGSVWSGDYGHTSIGIASILAHIQLTLFRWVGGRVERASLLVDCSFCSPQLVLPQLAHARGYADPLNLFNPGFNTM